MGAESGGVWMWSRAVALLDEAERRHRRFFELLPSAPPRQPVWEPPIDMFLLEGELYIVVAMPSARAEEVSVELVAGGLIVRAESRLPEQAGRSRILRLEIPYGRMERRIDLPAGEYQLRSHDYKDGCLQIRLAGEWA